MAAAALVPTCTPDAAFERPRKLFLEPGGSGSHPQSEEEIKDHRGVAHGHCVVQIHKHKYKYLNYILRRSP